jgi:hypothetical protein
MDSAETAVYHRADLASSLVSGALRVNDERR